MRGFAIIFAYYGLGVLLEHTLKLPLPGNVIGLLLFTISLFTKIIPFTWVESPAKWFNRHMLFFFTPFVVGTMMFFSMIAQQAVSIIGSLVISTLVVLVVTGGVTTYLENKQKKRSDSL